MEKTRGVRATMMLCDHVAVAGGKLYINGGGWALAGPGPMTSMGIALLLHVPWDLANTPLKVELRLLQEDGEPVLVPDAMGSTQPIEVSAEFEVGRPAGVKPGTALDVPIPVNVGAMALTPGARYYWELTVDDESEEDWHLPFAWRALPIAPSDPANLGPF